MTRGVQRTLRNHEEYLFHSKDSIERLGERGVDVKKIFTVTTLHELDEEYSRKVFGFDSLQVTFSPSQLYVIPSRLVDLL